MIARGQLQALMISDGEQDDEGQGTHAGMCSRSQGFLPSLYNDSILMARHAAGYTVSDNRAGQIPKGPCERGA